MLHTVTTFPLDREIQENDLVVTISKDEQLKFLITKFAAHCIFHGECVSTPDVIGRVYDEWIKTQINNPILETHPAGHSDQAIDVLNEEKDIEQAYIEYSNNKANMVLKNTWINAIKWYKEYIKVKFK